MAGGAGWRLAFTIYFTSRDVQRKLTGRTKMKHLPSHAGRPQPKRRIHGIEKQSREGEDCVARGKEDCLCYIKILGSSDISPLTFSYNFHFDCWADRQVTLDPSVRNAEVRFSTAFRSYWTYNALIGEVFSGDSQVAYG